MDVLLPGGRDVRGTLSEPDGNPAAVVVACPPHPQHGGSRRDPRLVAVSDALVAADIACLRFDYGSWDEGHGERADVRNAIRWARDEYDGTDSLPVGVFGYSFGASESLLASAATPPRRRRRPRSDGAARGRPRRRRGARRSRGPGVRPLRRARYDRRLGAGGRPRARPRRRNDRTGWRSLLPRETRRNRGDGALVLRAGAARVDVTGRPRKRSRAPVSHRRT